MFADDLKLFHLPQCPITLVAPLNERGILCPCGLIDHVISFDVSPSQASAKSRQSGRLSQVEGQQQQHEPQLLALGRSISCVPIGRPIHTRSSWTDFIHGLLVHPQGCQGCQKIKNNILQINLLSLCANI